MSTKTNDLLTNEQIIDQIKNMTALQLKDLVSAIEEAFGVTAAVATAPAAQTAHEEVSDQPKTVSVYLVSAGMAKLPVIKKIKEITGKELKDAKLVSDNASEKEPQLIAKDLDGEKAQAMKKEFEELGSTIVIK